MLPAPTTIATSTPWSCTAATWRATAATRSGSVPYSSSPINASPDSFNRMRWNAGAIAGQPIPWRAQHASDRGRSPAQRPRYPGLLAYGEAGKPAYDNVLAGRCGQLVAQLLDGLALELRVVHLLLEQHDRLQPRVQLAGDDFLAHVLRLVGRLLLVDARLGVAQLGRNLVPADVFDRRRRRDLH